MVYPTLQFLKEAVEDAEYVRVAMRHLELVGEFESLSIADQRDCLTLALYLKRTHGMSAIGQA